MGLEHHRGEGGNIGTESHSRHSKVHTRSGGG